MNTDADIARYFSVQGKPVTLTEFIDFWQSLSAEELWYFQWVDLEQLI